MESPQSDKPILVYDGNCSFCKLWIERWQGLTEDRVEYSPFQEVAEQFPNIPRESFVRAVRLIMPNGEVLSAAHAVFRTLALAPGWGWILWFYRRVPGVAPASEFAYRWVARHRNFLYRVMLIFWGRHFAGASYSIAGWKFLRV